MIKQLLSIFAVASIVTVNAQSSKNIGKNISLTTENTNNILSKITATTCGLITTQTSTALALFTTGTTSSCANGYVVGTNCYGDKEKANFFPASSYSTVASPSITALTFVFFRLNSSNIGTKGTGTVTLTIYSGTSSSLAPGTAIVSKTVSLASIVAAQTTTNSLFSYSVSLTSPIAAPVTGFFAAFSVPSSVGDTIALSQQSGTATPNFGWERQSDNLWYDMSGSSGWNISFKLSVYPTICGNSVSTGLDRNNELLNNVSIMPNPTNGVFNINTSFSESKNIKINISNILGQIILSNEYNAITNDKIQLDLTQQANGIYFVTVSNGIDKMVQRLIINK